MNRSSSIAIENVLEWTFGTVRGWLTPNQCKLPDHPERLAQSPGEFYADAQPPIDLAFDTLVVHPDLGQLARFSFCSPYESSEPVNNRVHGLADLRPEGQSRGSLIFLHGHSMPTYLPLEMLARPTVAAGFDVYFLALPYHMKRAPKGTWSGQLSLGADIERTALAFRQGVLEVRSLMTWLENKGSPIALAGVSLGGFTMSMVAAVDHRPRALVGIISGGSLAQVVFSSYPYRYIRRDLASGSISYEQLEAYWRLLGPMHWQPAIPVDRIQLLAGKFDTVVSPGNVNALWEAWGQPALQWFPCGHATMALHYRPAGKAMARFLQDRFQPC